MHTESLYENPKRVNNMTNVVDKMYFKELAEKDPEEVCARTSCRYDAATRSYILPAWGDEYVIHPHEARIEGISDPAHQPNNLFLLFVVYYLLRSEATAACNQWISEKDLPGGATFFRGPHEIPNLLISTYYNDDIDAFKERCAHLSGTALQMADAAYRFDITHNIPVGVLLWAGDDEFPSEAKILFDRTIPRHLTLDIIFSLAVEVCTRIARGGAVNKKP